jgi:hypothetical protein
MFISRVILTLSLLVASLACAHAPAQPELELTEQETAVLVEQIEQFMAMVQAAGGFYIVALSNVPVKAQAATIKAIETASHHELCCDIIGMPEPHTVIFRTEAGKVEAEKLHNTLSKLGCEAEFIEMPA